MAGIPYAYAVFSRTFQRTFSEALQIPIHVYADDIIALSLAVCAENDQNCIELQCEEAFGNKAASYENKVAPCLPCEVFGWHVDLITETL